MDQSSEALLLHLAVEEEISRLYAGILPMFGRLGSSDGPPQQNPRHTLAHPTNINLHVAVAVNTNSSLPELRLPHANTDIVSR